jgi:glycogen synthase
MHILMTADTVGGVWTYTRELVTQLSRRGVRITLVSFGEIPSAAQSEWLDSLPYVSYHPTAFRLEWMQEPESDLGESAELLKEIIDEVRPDLLHFNQFYYGSLDCDLPRIVVAHSDVVSWWVSVHGAEPPENDWTRNYRNNVRAGLSAADLVIAPTQWMLAQISRHYCEPKKKVVVYNGRDPGLFVPHLSKEEYAISVGRIWDAGKQATMLLRNDLPLPTVLIGSEQSPEGAVASAQSAGQFPNVQMKGPQSEIQLRHLFSRASMYVATSRYEPFGLAPSLPMTFLHSGKSGETTRFTSSQTMAKGWYSRSRNLHLIQRDATSMLPEPWTVLASNSTHRQWLTITWNFTGHSCQRRLQPRERQTPNSDIRTFPRL